MKIRYKSESYFLPDFLIVGVAKAATTSIYYTLKQHSSISMPLQKEPRFFSYWNTPPKFKNPATNSLVKNIVTDLSDYNALFTNLPQANKLLGEASTSYFYTADTTIRNIKEIYGEKAKDIKIIIVLRNPIERIWSQYNMHVRDNQEHEPLNKAVSPDCIQKRMNNNWPAGYDYLGYSRYSKNIELFLNNFDNVSILYHEDADSKWEQTMNSITSFLDISPINETKKKMFNSGGAPKNKITEKIASFIYKPNRIKSISKKILPISTRHFLRTRLTSLLFKSKGIPKESYNLLLKEFTEDILKTQKLTGRDLGSWLTKRH